MQRDGVGESAYLYFDGVSPSILGLADHFTGNIDITIMVLP